MSDYGEQGTEPVDDAAVSDPPTDEEVRAAQERQYPEQARTAQHGDPRAVLDDAELDGLGRGDDATDGGSGPVGRD